MDAEFDVAVKSAQFFDGVGVATCRFRVYLGCRAAGDALRHPQHGAAHLDLLADPVSLAPGRGAAEPNVGAEAAAMAADADLALVVAQASQVDEADYLVPLVAEAMARDVVETGGAAGFLAQVTHQKGADTIASFRGQGVLHHRGAIRRADGQHAGMRIEEREERGDPGVLHQAHEVLLLKPGWVPGVEAGVALGQGKGAIPGDAATRFDLRGFQRLRGQPLHRVTVEIFDAHCSSPLEGQFAFTHLDCQRVSFPLPDEGWGQGLSPMKGHNEWTSRNSPKGRVDSSRLPRPLLSANSTSRSRPSIC